MEKPAGLTPADWHVRYQLQAGWTAEIRKYLYQRASIQDARRVLEVGCGSGAVLNTLHEYSQARVVGLDIDLPILMFATGEDSNSEYVNGDALSVPFEDQVFDVVLCHYFLLWVGAPLAALKEMARVCKPGGYLLALAEPDHAGRIDRPRELEALGRLQTGSLERQGADIEAGRKLKGWFQQTGLKDIEAGLLGGQKSAAGSGEFQASEWEMLRHDLEGALTPPELARYETIDRQAWAEGSRVLHVPTFYAIGRVV